jgi:hypothetical protein
LTSSNTLSLSHDSGAEIRYVCHYSELIVFSVFEGRRVSLTVSPEHLRWRSPVIDQNTPPLSLHTLASGLFMV